MSTNNPSNSPDEHALLTRLGDMQSQIDALRASQQRRGMYRSVVIGALMLVLGSALTAGAQVVGDSLKVFAAGQPARAADVNFNFNLLKAWLESKVGPISDPGVTATSLASAGAITGVGAITGASVAAQNNVSGASLTIAGKDLSNHIRDYMRANCYVEFGWADQCDAGCNLPTKYGALRADDQCTGGNVGSDGTCTNWLGIGMEGGVDGNDKFFVRFHCN